MPVLYEKRDHIGVVTLSRPRRARVGPRLQRGSGPSLRGMEDDDEIRCAVLTATRAAARFPPAQSQDPKTHTQASPRPSSRAFQAAGARVRDPRRLPNLRRAVNGFAVGSAHRDVCWTCCRLEKRMAIAAGRARHLPAYGGATRLARWVGRATRCAWRSDSRYRGRAHASAWRSGWCRSQSEDQPRGRGAPRSLPRWRRSREDRAPRPGHSQPVGRFAGGSLPLRRPRVTETRRGHRRGAETQTRLPGR